jgi:hypothetical protein
MTETSKARVTITLGRSGQVFFFSFQPSLFFNLKIRFFFLVMDCSNGRLYCCLERK